MAFLAGGLAPRQVTLEIQLNPRDLLLLLIASSAIAGVAKAEGPAESSPLAAVSRRETTVGIGYASIAPLKMPVGFDKANIPLSSATFSGYAFEVTRRVGPQIEYGLVTWLNGSSSDGRGSYAHALSRAAGEVRFLPWGFTRVEPWIGAELGLVLADDYAIWNATAKAGPHAVSTTRLGHIEAFAAGARLRLSDSLAIGARGGLMLLGFARASVEHEQGAANEAYLIAPTDYRTRLWYSAMLSAEITVTD